MRLSRCTPLALTTVPAAEEQAAATKGATKDAVTKTPAVPVTRASLVFYVHCQSKVLGRPGRVSLAVSKPGKTSLVNGPAGEGEVDGRFELNVGMTSDAVVGYYEGLLENAGWKYPADFAAGHSAIHFFGISSLGAGSNLAEIKAYATTDSRFVKFVQLEIPKD